MGEPSFNKDVLKVLNTLPDLYDAQGLLLSLFTIAPVGRKDFFEKLLAIKKRYCFKRLKLQFSIHSTDAKTRDWLIPVRKWNFQKIAEYGERFYENGGKKITPVSPTYRSGENRLSS